MQTKVFGLWVVGLAFPLWLSAGQQHGVIVTDLPDQGKVRIEINGQLFSYYIYRGYSRPILYPVMGPGQIPMTRNWPLKNVPGETHDHPHHKSLWWAHGDINGVDFWSESPRAGKIVHQEFLKLCSGEKEGEIQTRNWLVTKEGKRIGTVDFDIHIYNVPNVRIMDFNVTVRATDGDLVFGDTKEGTMAIRVAESMRVRPNEYNKGKPHGHMLNSEGVQDAACWGKRASWVDYYGPVKGQIMGIAIFDHPANPRHPTWWHARDYGLFAANPFGVHHFEGKPAGTGDFHLKNGQSVTWRYRFVFHRGNTKQARIAELYQQYARRTE